MTFRVLEISRFGLFYIKQSSACKSFWVITLDFTIPRHDGNENVKKNNRFRLATKQLCTCITLFCTFLCLFCTATTWNCLILLFRDGVNKRRRNFILFLNLNMVLRNSTPRRFAYIWRSKWVEIIAIKTERTQLHFWSDVFAAVAPSDREVPDVIEKLTPNGQKMICYFLTYFLKVKLFLV